jgi:hypothetical protein
MNWNPHLELEGRHAFLSPSGYHWLNYEDDKLVEVYNNERAKQEGTELHDLAAKLIDKGIRPEDDGTTFSLYVRDAVYYKMDPEIPLKYSEKCFGRADAISFRRNLLRIHDLKTGTTKASEKQLYVYAALFCLEYKHKPKDIKIECRIYQNNQVQVYNPEPDEITAIMKNIIHKNRILCKLDTEDKLDL